MWERLRLSGCWGVRSHTGPPGICLWPLRGCSNSGFRVCVGVLAFVFDRCVVVMCVDTTALMCVVHFTHSGVCSCARQGEEVSAAPRPCSKRESCRQPCPRLQAHGKQLASVRERGGKVRGHTSTQNTRMVAVPWGGIWVMMKL